MIVRKAALSLFVLAASGAYVWSQIPGREPSLAGGNDAVALPLRAEPLAAAVVRPAPAAQDAPPTAPAPLRASDSPQAIPPLSPPPVLPAEKPLASALVAGPVPAEPPAEAPLPTVTAPVRVGTIPAPRPRPQYHEPATGSIVRPVAMTNPAPAAYADGTYTGPAVDAYYGLVQIQAIVSGGRLTSIKVLQYPSDRRTSVFINRQALPMLRDEVVSVQSAQVDIVSGATLTSEAFIRSLDAALRQARS